jgi:hypothetical protein
MGLGVFSLLAGRLDESRTHFQEVLLRDPGRAQARLMLSFIDGSLPASERGPVCTALREVAGRTTIEGCEIDPP